MMVQAMVIFYGLALAFGISLDRTVAALFIVSVNTGAYMSEIVRGGIFADKGQFEAAQAIGMTMDKQCVKSLFPKYYVIFYLQQGMNLSLISKIQPC